MTKILWPFMGKFLIVYFNYILIYSHSGEQYLEHLCQLCIVLKKNEFYANPMKCAFLSTQVHFLGFVVSSKGVFVDPEKVRAIEEWPKSKIICEVRSFHGLAIFYRWFIKKVQHCHGPDYGLSKEKWACMVKFAAKAFIEIKTRMIGAPIMRHLDLNLLFIFFKL